MKRTHTNWSDNSKHSLWLIRTRRKKLHIAVSLGELFFYCSLLDHDHDFFPQILIFLLIRSRFFILIEWQVLIYLSHALVSLASVCFLRLILYGKSYTRSRPEFRPAYLYRFSLDIPILALNHDFPISCGGVPILEDAGIFRARRFRFVLFSPVFRRFLILSASCTYRQSRRCVAAINSPPGAMSQC